MHPSPQVTLLQPDFEDFIVAPGDRKKAVRSPAMQKAFLREEESLSLDLLLLLPSEEVPRRETPARRPAGPLFQSVG